MCRLPRADGVRGSRAAHRLPGSIHGGGPPRRRMGVFTGEAPCGSVQRLPGSARATGRSPPDLVGRGEHMPMEGPRFRPPAMPAPPAEGGAGAIASPRPAPARTPRRWGNRRPAALGARLPVVLLPKGPPREDLTDRAPAPSVEVRCATWPASGWHEATETPGSPGARVSRSVRLPAFRLDAGHARAPAVMSGGRLRLPLMPLPKTRWLRGARSRYRR